MKKLLFVLLIVPSICLGWESYQYQKQDQAELKFNVFENKWSYQEKSDVIKYNVIFNTCGVSHSDNEY